MNPNSSEKFPYFRSVQVPPGGTLVDPSLQENVLLPDDFAEYIYQGTLTTCTPSSTVDWFWEVSLRRDKHSVFFTFVNPMYTYQHQEEVQYDLDESRIAVYKNT